MASFIKEYGHVIASFVGPLFGVFSSILIYYLKKYIDGRREIGQRKKIICELQKTFDSLKVPPLYDGLSILNKENYILYKLKFHSFHIQVNFHKEGIFKSTSLKKEQFIFMCLFRFSEATGIWCDKSVEYTNDLYKMLKRLHETTEEEISKGANSDYKKPESKG